MRNRRFGVELEFYTDGQGASGIGDLLWENGFKEEWTGAKREDRYYGTSYGNIGYDGSELELRSPILQGVKGFKDLQRVVELLNEAGCGTTEDDGLHVHHDAPDFAGNKDLQLRLLKSWKFNEIHIAKFVDEGRADWSMNEQYDSPCPSVRFEDIQNWEYSNAQYFPTPYERCNLNLNALREHGSIEFRFHEGTLNWDEIESWIHFGQRLLNGVKARKNPIPTVDNPVVLLNRLKVNDRSKRRLAYKAGFSRLVTA